MKARLKNVIDLFKFINNHPLGRKHKLKAYFKFLKWQILQFLKPQERKVSFTDKSKLFVKKGMTGATGNIYLGLHEFNDMGFLLHFLRPNDTFYDIGANVGSYTVLASAHCGAFTFCFEPIPNTFKSLLKNIEINNIQHLVQSKNVGLGDKIDKLTFTKSRDTVNHVLPDNLETYSEETIEVKILTADSFLKESTCPALIKIDVEGFETKVINGMSEIISDNNLKAIIIELNGSGMRYGFDESKIHDTLLANNFNAFSYNPFDRSLKEQKFHGTFNTIYLRDMPYVKNRIEQADKINIFSESF